MSAPKTEKLRVVIVLGDVQIEYEALLKALDGDEDEARRVRRVMAAATEVGFALLDVPVHKEEHRV